MTWRWPLGHGYIACATRTNRACATASPTPWPPRWRACPNKPEGAAAAHADSQAAELGRTQMILSFAPVFGDLGREPRLVQIVARHTRSLRECGVFASLHAAAG